MFAIVRTGGKQYRVAAGDKIAVEKIAGEAGDSVTLDDVLLAGEGNDVKAGGVTVAAEIVAQAKGEKVIVFKKRRRHNYRRKAGHRQQYTILQIVSIGGKKAEAKKVETKKADVKAEAAPAAEKPAKAAKAETAKAEAKAEAPKKAAATKAAPAKKAAEKADAAPAKKASTKKAAPAKGE